MTDRCPLDLRYVMNQTQLVGESAELVQVKIYMARVRIFVASFLFQMAFGSMLKISAHADKWSALEDDVMKLLNDEAIATGLSDTSVEL